MSNAFELEPSELEKRAVSIIGDTSLEDEDVRRLLPAIPDSERFAMTDTWIDLARLQALSPWRRLKSCSILLHHCLHYPLSRQRFLTGVCLPLGISEDQIVDMTMAQYVPVGRNTGELILMATLPILTADGPAAIYSAIDRSRDEVLRAVVHPSDDQQDTLQ